MSISEGRKVVNDIIDVTIVNDDKNIKWNYELKNKLIIFTYYLKLFFTLSYTIELFYQPYLIYLII